MIEVGRFQPGNVRRDLKKIFEDRQCAANQSRSQDSISDSEGALHSDHAPIVGRRIKQINRPDQTKRQRQEPDGDPHAESGTDQLATSSHL